MPAAMEVEQSRDAIRLRLEARPGDRSTSEIAACLDCTTAKVAEAGAHD